MKRYPWRWDPELMEVWGMIVDPDTARVKLLRHLPKSLAARLLRRAGRCHDAGCTGNAEKCAACCGRGGGR